MFMALMFLALFAGFYQKAYNSNKKVKRKLSKDFGKQMTEISNGFNKTQNQL